MLPFHLIRNSKANLPLCLQFKIESRDKMSDGLHFIREILSALVSQSTSLGRLGAPEGKNTSEIIYTSRAFVHSVYSLVYTNSKPIRLQEIYLQYYNRLCTLAHVIYLIIYCADVNTMYLKEFM